MNTDEMLVPEGGFRTINRFFTRSLLPGARVMDVSPASIVSPVDARVDQYGRINSNLLIQAKGIDYTLEGLIPSPMHEKFIDGDFITLYLSPGDYHRIHSPVSGLIYGYQHVPGKLFTVQDFMVRSFPDLFSVNERITSYIGTDAGFVAVCKVGATNVGRISLSYDSIISNKTFRSRKEVLYPDNERKPIERGGELGTFNLGSTVVALFEKGMVKFEPMEIGSKVRMGQRIAVLAR